MLQDLVQEIRNVANDAVNNVHTAMPGTISSAGGASATVQPSGEYKIPKGQKMAYPAVSGAPIVMPCSTGGEIGVFWPVSGGDSCLIVYSENEIDEHMSESKAENTLKFDMTNAVAIPGLLKSAPPATDGLLLKAGDTTIELLKDGTIKIKCEKMEIEGDVEIKGDVKIEGDIKVEGDTDISGTAKASSHV